MAIFEYRTNLECCPESLFEFLLRPANIADISDPDLGLTFVQAPEVVEQGSRIAFEIQGYGRVQRITHEITDVTPTHQIIEVQIDGPMRAWTHRHLFRDTENGTEMLDAIEFTPPGGIIGLMMSEDRIIDSLERGFFYRQQQLQRLTQSGNLK